MRFLRIGHVSGCLGASCCLLISSAALGGAPAVKSCSINVVRSDSKFAGYDLSALDFAALVRLQLIVNDADAGADFKPGSGSVSSAGGAVAWSEVRDLAHVYEAESAQFQRFHRVYVAYTRGEWTIPVGPGKPAKKPIWEVDVYQVRIIDGLNIPFNNKLLATAKHPIRAEVKVARGRKAPTGTVAWSYPGGGTFTPADLLRTHYTAPTALTAVGQEDDIYYRVQYTPANAPPSADSHPLNITAPQLFTADKSDGIIYDRTTPRWINSNSPRAVRLINTSVTYEMYDQFSDKITKSDRGNKHIQIREDVPWSGVRGAPAWGRTVRTTSSWTNKDTGKFTDGLNPPAFPTVRIIDPATRPPRRKFNLARNTEVLAVRFHVWHASVSGAVDTTFTRNVLSVTVDASEDKGAYDRIKLRTTYRLEVTKRL